MASLFSKIVCGDIPCYKVAEDDDFLAFLDLHPLRLGHTLVIPKVEVDYFFDLDDTQMTHLMLFSKKVAKLLKEKVPCKKIGVSVIGLEVPHAHVHLVPIDDIEDMNFKRPKLELSTQDFEDLLKTIHT
jgi:histidine triad (HIT) family protein